MKKVMNKFGRIIAALLAFAMVVTGVPNVGPLKAIEAKADAYNVSYTVPDSGCALSLGTTDTIENYSGSLTVVQNDGFFQSAKTATVKGITYSNAAKFNSDPTFTFELSKKMNVKIHTYGQDGTGQLYIDSEYENNNTTLKVIEKTLTSGTHTIKRKNKENYIFLIEFEPVIEAPTTLTFDYNGGVDSAGNKDEVSDTTQYAGNTLSIPTVSYAEHTLLGWHKESDTEHPDSLIGADEKVPATATTYTAIWANNADYKKVNIEKTDGVTVALDDSVQGLEIDTELSYKVGQEIIVNVNVTAEDKVLKDIKYSTKLNPEGVELTKVDATTYKFNMPNEDVTVEATLEDEVAYTADIASESEAYLEFVGKPEKIVKDTLIKVATKGIPENKGVKAVKYTKSGTSEEVEADYDSKNGWYQFNMPASNVEISVELADLVTVSFKTLIKGKEITIASDTKIAKDGKLAAEPSVTKVQNFSGVKWYEENTYETEITDITDHVFSADTTVWGKYQEKTFTVPNKKLVYNNPDLEKDLNVFQDIKIDDNFTILGSNVEPATFGGDHSASDAKGSSRISEGPRFRMNSTPRIESGAPENGTGSNGFLITTPEGWDGAVIKVAFQGAGRDSTSGAALYKKSDDVYTLVPESYTESKNGSSTTTAQLVCTVPAGVYSLEFMDSSNVYFIELVEARNYSITLNNTSDKGTISVASTSVLQGSTVKVKGNVTDSDYVLDSISVVAEGETEPLEVTAVEDEENAYTFTMPEKNVSITPTFKKAYFGLTATSVTGVETKFYKGKVVGDELTEVTEINKAKAGSKVYMKVNVTDEDIAYKSHTLKQGETDVPNEAEFGYFSFTMPEGDVEAAISVAQSYAITIPAQPVAENKVTTVPEGKAAEEAEVTISTVAKAEWEVTEIKVIKSTTGGEVTVTDGKFEMPADDVTINVTFAEIPKYTVEFNTAGKGTVSENQVTIIRGGKVTNPGSLKCAGYNFDGWYKTEDGEDKWDFDNDTVTGPAVIYAHWSENPVPEVIAAGTTAVLGLEEADKGNVERNTLYGNNHFLLITNSDKSGEATITTIDTGNKKFGDDTKSYPCRIKLRGIGAPDNSALMFKTADAADIKLYVRSGNKAIPSTINIGKLASEDATSFTKIGETTALTVSTDADCVVANYHVEEAGTYYIYSDDTLGNIYEVFVTVKGLTVSFDANGHGTAPEAITNLESGAKVTKPTDPSEEGFIFEGWFKEAACENEWNFTTDTVTVNTTLYAKWRERSTQKYTVTVNSSTNGTVTADVSEALEGDTVTLTVTPDPGYVLDELKVMNETTAVDVADSKFTMPAGNVTVTATFKANETPEPVKGTIQASDIMTKAQVEADHDVPGTDKSDKMRVKTLEDDKTNGIFTVLKGTQIQYVDSKGNDVKVTIGGNDYIGRFTTGQVKTKNPATTGERGIKIVMSSAGTIKLGAETGSAGDATRLIALYKEDGTEVKSIQAPDPAAEIEFNVTEPGTYVIGPGNLGENAGKSSNIYYIDIAAKAKTYTVTFNSQGGSTVASVSDLESGAKVPVPAEPSKSGYTFDGWYKEAACTTAWNFDTDTVTADVTLYAKWTQNEEGTYNVTVILPVGGKVTVDKKVAKENDVVTVTVEANDGYVFKSLDVEKKNGGAVATTQSATDASKYTFVMPAEEVKVQASFEVVPEGTYTVKVVSTEGGIVSANKVTAKKDETITLSNKANEGYTFDSYIVKDAAGKSVAVENSTFKMPASNVTVSGNFIKNAPGPKPPVEEEGLTLEWLDDVEVVNGKAQYTYTGSPIVPNVSVRFNGENLMEGTDYTLAVKNNTAISAGAAAAKRPVVIVTGKGAYGQKGEFNFDILKADIKDATIPSTLKVKAEAKIDVKIAYNGVALKNGKDYKLSKDKAPKSGEMEVTVTGLGNFTGTTTFTVVTGTPDPAISAKFNSVKLYYTGADQVEAVKAKVIKEVTANKKVLKKDAYVVSIYPEKVVDAGNYTVVVTPAEGTSASGYVAKKITVNAISAGKAVDEGKFIVINNGKVKGKDAVILKDSAATYSPLGAKADVEASLVSYNIVKYKNGSETVTAPLVAGKDYTVTFSGNKKAGDNIATATLKLKGNFKGSIKTYYTINKADITEATIVSANAAIYDKKPLTAFKGKIFVDVDNVTVKASEYTTTFYTEDPAGKSSAELKKIELSKTHEFKMDNSENEKLLYFRIEGKKVNYAGVQDGSVLIQRKPAKTGKIKDASKLKIAVVNKSGAALKSLEYTGEAITVDTLPEGCRIEVKDGTKKLSPDNYDITLVNNKEIGKASIVVNGKGAYAGSSVGTIAISAYNCKNGTAK